MFKANIRSLAPEYFRKSSSSNQISDAEYARMRRQLQSALHLPSENRWIAEWLFSDAQSAFHTNICLSPDSFQQAYAIRMNHQFFSSSSKNQDLTDSFSRSQAHSDSEDGLILVPVANIEQYTVGYAFLQGSNSIERSTSAQTPFCGRFAFDRRKKEFLIAMHDVPVDVDANIDSILLLMNMRWSGDGYRQHCLLGCPNKEYSFYNLPNQVLTICQTLSKPLPPSGQPADMDILDQFLQQSTPHAAVNSMDGIQLDPTDILLGNENPLDMQSISQSVPEISNPLKRALELEAETQLLDEMTSSVTSYMPWIVSENGQTSDGIGMSQHAISGSISSGSFDLDKMASALAGIESAMRGDFYGAKKAQKFIHPTTGQLYEGFSGMVFAKFHPASGVLRSKLKDMATKLYFTSMISLSHDNRLQISAGKKAEVEQMGSEEMQDQVHSNVGSDVGSDPAVSLAPRLGDERRTEGRGQQHSVHKSLTKEEKKEEKRRKNRLSAARSNERRRVELEWKKRTLVELRTRVVELQLRKKTLSLENQVLRSQISFGNNAIY